MKLELYSSKRGAADPNLVAVQAADLDMLPTVLVCPLLPGEALTAVRADVALRGRRYTVMCDLVRPINRRALVRVGMLDERESRQIMAVFSLLLAR